MKFPAHAELSVSPEGSKTPAKSFEQLFVYEKFQLFSVPYCKPVNNSENSIVLINNNKHEKFPLIRFCEIVFLELHFLCR